MITNVERKGNVSFSSLDGFFKNTTFHAYIIQEENIYKIILFYPYREELKEDLSTLKEKFSTLKGCNAYIVYDDSGEVVTFFNAYDIRWCHNEDFDPQQVKIVMRFEYSSHITEVFNNLESNIVNVPINDKWRKLIYNTTETTEENKDMEKTTYRDIRLNDRLLQQTVINEKEKIVTVFSKVKNRCITFENSEDKVVTMSKCHKDDEFDKYVGTALALAYQLFGSKTQFHKYVDNQAKYLSKVNEKKENAKNKKVAKDTKLKKEIKTTINNEKN